MTDERMIVDEAPKRKGDTNESRDELDKRLKLNRQTEAQQSSSSAAAASTSTSAQVQPSTAEMDIGDVEA